jgi:hypothetical protein
VRHTELENLAKFLQAARALLNAAHADGVFLGDYPQHMTKRRKAQLQSPRLIV